MTDRDAVSPAEGRRGLARFALDLSPLQTSRPYRQLWLASAIEFAGARMVVVAAYFQVYELTESSLAVGLLAVTQLVPLVTLTIAGGALADAVDRRKLVLVSTAGATAAFAGLAVNASRAEPRLWVLFALTFVAWGFFSIGSGAMRSITPRLVSTEQLPAAAALHGVATNTAAIAGPAAAGLLIDRVGIPWAFTLGALAAAVAIVCLYALPPIPPLGDVERVTLSSMAGGFRYLGQQQVVLAFFLVDSVAMIFGMPNALFPALADERFGDAEVVGYLFAAPAVGAVVASLASGWAGRVRRQGVAIVVAVIGWGLSITIFGFADALWLALAMLACAGAADQVSAIFRSTIVMTVTPDHLRGRLGGIEMAQVASTPALGNLEAGIVASLTSVTFSIVSGGIACIVATLAVVAALPSLVRYDARASR